ncbi:MAG: tetratricopeptide repeat protein [Candidatus Helarchaeota archaeon]
MKLEEIIENLKRDEFSKVEEAAKKLLKLDKNDFENYGFDNAVNELIEILEMYNEIEIKKPDFWKEIENKNKFEDWNNILENIREKLRELEITPYILNDKGIDAQDNNDYDKALHYYKQAIILDPNYRWSWYNLGNIYRNEDNNEKAIACYKRAVEIYPDYGDAWNNMGNAYFDLDDLDNALETYEKAANIKSYPNKNYPLYNIGLIYEKKGDRHKAIDYFKKAISYKKDYAKAHYNAGRVLYKMGDYLEANKYFTNALIYDFDTYHKDIEEFKINIYDLLGKHLIKDFLEYLKLELEQDSIYNDKDLIELLKNRTYPLENEINSILNDADFKNNWSKNFLNAKSENIETFINSWIIKTIDKDDRRINSIIYNDLIIKLIFKSLEYFPGTKISNTVHNKLKNVVFEAFNYYKKIIRACINNVKSKDYDLARDKLMKFFKQFNNEKFLLTYKNEFLTTIITIFNNFKGILDDNNKDDQLIQLNSEFINDFLSYINEKIFSHDLVYILLDMIQFFYDYKNYKIAYNCAKKVKLFFDKLDYKTDSKKVEKIIKKLKEKL